MKNRIAATIVALICIAGSAFAAEKRSPSVPWLVSYESAGALALTGAGGISSFGWDVNGGIEYTINQFQLGPLPLSWGITGEASLGFDPSGLGMAIGALATLNLGFDFGKNLVFEAFIGLGPGAIIETWGGGGSGFGLAEYAGWTWWFAHDIGVTAEEGYVSAFEWGTWGFLGVGLTLRL